MKSNYTFTILIMIALLVIQTTLFSQNNEKPIPIEEKSGKYDEWITIDSNANIKNALKDKSGGARTNFVTIGNQWNKRIITYFFQNGTPDITGNTEQTAIRDAMNIWSNTIDIFFIQVCNQADADISFLFASGNHGDPIPDCEPGIGAFDGQGGVFAHNMGGPDPGNNCGTQGADIHFDESEDWTDAIRGNDNQPIDLVTVAAHELGHALGLNHTTISGSLMLSVYSGSHRFLGSDDIAGIISIYGGLQTNVPISAPSLICSTGQFSLYDQPGNATVVWSSGNSGGLSINATTGVATRQNNFDGGVTITATLSTGCGVVDISKNVWVGRPSPPGAIIGATSPTYGNTYAYSSLSDAPGAGAYTWSAPTVGSPSWIIYAPTNTLAVAMRVGSAYGYVRVYGVNSCGTGTPASKYITPTSGGGGGGGGGGQFRTSMPIDEISKGELIAQLNEPEDYIDGIPSPYPNPAVDELIIEYTHAKAEELVKNFMKKNGLELDNPPYLEDPIEYNLFDLNGKLLRQAKSKDTKFIMDVRNVPRGTYVLGIKYGQLAVEKHKVLIAK